ncbi:flagellar brake protein [Pelomonas sp. CA6]|uniref:flagellar brake protein n=1 Tax=Pelomonas sp. CA6 TaxID=2907999 RepID=UPI001F4BE34F|nr:flagellar brake protein [Pelomonas sp. CA6]MCH7345840.1 flagellar brake protein [Pelomonas sp. CA6]
MPDTRAARSSPAEFRLDSPAEIQGWLRELLARQQRIQLCTPDGLGVHSVLLALDATHGALSLEVPPENEALDELLQSQEVQATAYLDRIRLEFELPGLCRVDGASGRVLRAALPTELYRFQRRQAYRVSAGSGLYPALCLGGEAPLRLRVINLSMGGLALLWPATLELPAEQALIEGAELELDLDTQIALCLRVQHVTPAEGPHPAQLGCGFEQLSAMAARALQRYIDQAQKRERLMRRTSGAD